MERGTIPKPLAFRPTETSEKIITDIMSSKGYDALSDAVNFLIESSQIPKITNAEKTQPLPNVETKAPLRSTPQIANVPCATLERELQRFFYGYESPLIALMLSDIPRKNPNLATTAVSLHDTT